MAFANSLKLSALATGSDNWITSSQLMRSALQFEPDIFLSVVAHLIAHPNLNSSLLYRADILHDSAGLLQTPEDRERELLHDANVKPPAPPPVDIARPAATFPGVELKRTVVRKFIPRNHNLDRQLDQTCHFYENTTASRNADSATEQANGHQTRRETHLVVYTPHVSTQDELPWYHPIVRGVAFLYEFDFSTENDPQDPQHKGCGTLSLHFLPFSSPGIPDEIPHRLERTLLGLMSTQLRLIRGTAQDPAERRKPKPYKDNIIPQHLLQNTYTRLKDKYATNLIENWVESTESSKHVFEDINIAAFLIELWRLIYKVGPNEGNGEGNAQDNQNFFPGFVDIACGNGVLVHILLSEGYEGWGFDARHRKTWSIFPSSTQQHLKEAICIPAPFKNSLDTREPNFIDPTVKTHTGIFKKDTFIISNHADELTVWTPLLGTLSNPTCPLPFLAIPCCSHALSGARFRYPPPKESSKRAQKSAQSKPAASSRQAKNPDQEPELDPQPPTGDLKALRVSKQEAQQDPGSISSTYGCLTAKVASVAEEIGYDVEKTLLRIPSTRNMGVVGGIKLWTSLNRGGTSGPDNDESGRDTSDMKECVWEVVERESKRDGGVESASKLWAERSLGLQKTQGRGKLKGGAQHG